MAFSTKSILPVHTSRVDFNGDGNTDFVWAGADGTFAVWNRSHDALSGVTGLFIPGSELRVDVTDPRSNILSPKGLGDVHGDGTTDLVMQDLAGRIQTWSVHDNQVVEKAPLTIYGQHYPIQATGDFDGNGHIDLLWRVPPAPVAGGADGVWVTGTAENRPIPPRDLGAIKPFSIDFQFVGVGDFNGDGRDDMMFRGGGNATVGTFMIQQSEAAKPGDVGMQTTPLFFADPLNSWSVLGIADFNGDGKSDIFWQHSNAEGQTDGRSIWLMNGNQVIGGGMVANPGDEWSAAGIDDYSNDGKADIMWRHGPTGNFASWYMDGSAILNPNGAWFINPGDFWTFGAI